MRTGIRASLAELEATSYTVDSALRIVGTTNESNPARSWNYTYDSLDRLLSAGSVRVPRLGGIYDGDGNRLLEVAEALRRRQMPPSLTIVVDDWRP